MLWVVRVTKVKSVIRVTPVNWEKRVGVTRVMRVNASE